MGRLATEVTEATENLGDGEAPPREMVIERESVQTVNQNVSVNSVSSVAILVVIVGDYSPRRARDKLPTQRTTEYDKPQRPQRSQRRKMLKALLLLINTDITDITDINDNSVFVSWCLGGEHNSVPSVCSVASRPLGTALPQAIAKSKIPSRLPGLRRSNS